MINESHKEFQSLKNITDQGSYSKVFKSNINESNYRSQFIKNEDFSAM
jgi:hypothetical protein